MEHLGAAIRHITISRKTTQRILLTLLASNLIAIAVVFMLSQAQAGGVTTALYSMSVNITNTGSSDLDDIQAPFSFSATTLIDGNFIASDTLNALIHKGTTDVPGMPPSNRIQVEGAVQGDGVTFTEYTTAAQNTALNDVPLLPAAAVVDDAFYFGCDNPCRIVTWDVDTVGVGTWTLTYEYWDASDWTALSNVDDRSTGFTVLGRNTASWDMPTNWATRATTGSAVTSYWGRARVSAFTSETTQPLGSRVFYENGQWWTWVEDLNVDTQEQFALYLGGSTDLATAHQVFPGSDGIITGDAAALEVGGTYSIAVAGRLDFSAAGATACILCKTSTVTLNVSGSASSPVIGTSITGGGTSTADLTGLVMPTSGEQTIIIVSDGTNAATFVAASGGGMVSYSVQTWADNANNWTWASNGGLDYFDSIWLDADSPTIYNFETTTTNFTTGSHTNTAAFNNSLRLASQ